jgi:hypothetical protein
MKKITLALKTTIAMFSILYCLGTYAQDTKKADVEAIVKNLVESRQYKFMAQSATPQKGHTRQIDRGYDIKIMGDSISAYLPYMGRSYTGSYGTSEGPIQFKTNDFDYTSTPNKKGWDVVVTPKNIRNARQINMTIYSDALMSVVVSSSGRDVMRFEGHIEYLKTDSLSH